MQKPGKKIIPEIFKKKKTVFDIFGKDQRRGEALPRKMLRDPHERRNGDRIARRIHQYGRIPAAMEAVIAPRRGVSGQQRLSASGPSGLRQKRRHQTLTHATDP